MSKSISVYVSEFSSDTHIIGKLAYQQLSDKYLLPFTDKEQLEKARDIMRKLKEDKRKAIEQAEEKIRSTEASLEEEKERMLTELKRGKSEAFSVMQVGPGVYVLKSIKIFC